MLKELIRQTIQRTGYDLIRRGPERRGIPPDIVEPDRTIIGAVKPFTWTSNERLISLINAVRFVVRNRIDGDFVECGVWKGGSTMAAALALIDEGDAGRELYLYDTFEGMSEPTDADRNHDGVPAASILENTPMGEGFWCRSPLDEVKENLESTGYPAEKIHYVKGKVEDTIPANLPGKISILRLDTDWYESTRHELLHLFPLLADGGFLIIDDYGYWEGARKAVDEFLATSAKKYFLHRIDSTGRLIIK